jgi:Thiol-disulfide isomerase and thioredoxins
MLGFAGCSQHSAGPTSSKEKVIAPGEVGSRLPDFSTPDFPTKDLQGHAWSSADLRGKVVLIDFWATWCQPCKKEMPGYQKLADAYGPRGFVVVGFKLNMMRDEISPTQFAKQMHIRYPLVSASDELTSKFGGIEGIPTTMLYDRQGILRKKVIGFEYAEAFESALKPLL